MFIDKTIKRGFVLLSSRETHCCIPGPLHLRELYKWARPNAVKNGFCPSFSKLLPPHLFSIIPIVFSALFSTFELPVLIAWRSYWGLPATFPNHIFICPCTGLSRTLRPRRAQRIPKMVKQIVFKVTTPFKLSINCSFNLPSFWYAQTCNSFLPLHSQLLKTSAASDVKVQETY